MTSWIVDELGHDVLMRSTAFHPDFKLTDRPATPARTIVRARRVALDYGVRFAYTGNMHDPEGSSSYCPSCGIRVIGRDRTHSASTGSPTKERVSRAGARSTACSQGRRAGWGAGGYR